MTPAALTAIRDQLRGRASALGLLALAVTDARASARLPLYEEWIAKQYHGEMAYLSRPDRIARRKSLELILPQISRVITVALPYWPKETRRSSDVEQKRGVVSCYAWGVDYHQLLSERLTALCDWLASQLPESRQLQYVDTGPLMESDLAERAGLGFVGKHTLLIAPRFGSGLFLGEILTTAELPCDPPRHLPTCGRCTRCIDVCPTAAFPAPYVLDARRCISYLTIELKGSIPVPLRPLIGNLIYGCDFCQEVCPWNRFARRAPTALYGSPALSVTAPELTGLLALDSERFRQRFQGTAIMRLKRDRFLRNVAVALGNCGDPAVLPNLRRALGDPSPLVGEHIAWAISQLTGKGTG